MNKEREMGQGVEFAKNPQPPIFSSSIAALMSAQPCLQHPLAFFLSLADFLLRTSQNVSPCPQLPFALCIQSAKQPLGHCSP